MPIKSFRRIAGPYAMCDIECRGVWYANCLVGMGKPGRPGRTKADGKFFAVTPEGEDLRLDEAMKKDLTQLFISTVIVPK